MKTINEVIDNFNKIIKNSLEEKSIIINTELSLEILYYLYGYKIYEEEYNEWVNRYKKAIYNIKENS